MAACLITSISLLSLFYILKLIKRKFKDEHREKIKKSQIIIQVIFTLPLFAYMVLIEVIQNPFITILTTLIFILGYALYVKKFRNIKK
ncbi:hypothetical protein FDF86_10550 [Clostridium botulinum]|nr:hypothetical protein [Clostridium botulinum]NFO15126.1 hypothetical protein [Clostridium botulinum]NFP00805.1 hypothetical protein [Clostridium botulinum]NFT92828.1 hypothetical protein [Clostridium botulinum]